MGERGKLTEEERQAAVVAKYPSGLTAKQFRLATLESADEAGRVYPPWVKFTTGMSIIIGMQLDGLLTRPGGHHSAGPWYITDKGRAALTKPQRDEGGAGE